MPTQALWMRRSGAGAAWAYDEMNAAIVPIDERPHAGLVDRPTVSPCWGMFVTPVAEDAAQGDLAEYYQRQRRSWGFLPDYAGAFSTRPDVAAAWDRMNDTVRNGMDRRRFEIATIAAARAMHSTYCTAAHSKFLRDVCGDEATVRAIAERPDGSSLDDADRAVYEFAAKVAADASQIDQADVDRLEREAGLSDADVADVVFAVAARSFFTRVLDGLGAQLDRQTSEALPADLRDAMVVGRPVLGQVNSRPL